MKNHHQRQCLPKIGQLAITAAIAVSFTFSTQVIAQDSDDDVLDEIIIIGTAGGAGINKADASFAVSVINDEEIERISPKSTADLLKTIPGVWAESSGGVAGANIDVRGLPGGGDAPFVTLTLNGSPLYGTESLSFFEQSTMFRIDETIASVEGLRGGPGVLFGKGEPGLTVNFNLKEGGEETEGRVKYTTSDYELQRFDAVLSGELAEDFYYMIGGYVQQSPGIRDAQFISEEGHQFTINLTKDFDRGSLNVYSRITDDHGQWYLPMALNVGNDLGTFSQLGNATRLREIQVSAGGDTQVFDFADGRGWDGSVSGVNFDIEVGNGWTLRDNLGFTSGDANTFGFVPSGGPTTAGALSTVIGGPVTTLDGRTLAAGDSVQTYGHWVVLKELRSFANDISLNKSFDNGHDLTFGLYQSTFASDDWWSLGNPIPVHNVANGDLLDAAITSADIAAAGGDGGFMFGLASAGDAQTTAFYIADSWQINDAFRLDFGIRQESFDIDYVLDTGPGFPDGVRDLNTSLSDDQTAYTVGGNWQISESTGFFGRYAKGYLFPSFDNVREGSLTVDDIDQFEFGVKYIAGNFDVFATAFYNTNDAFSSAVGGVVPAASFETESTGLEIDATATFGDFNIGVTGTFQSAEITASTTAADVGNSVLRQPDFQVRFSPSFNFEAGSMQGTIYGAITLVDDRFGDNGNTVALDSYEKIDIGVQLQSDSGLFFQLHADNVSDEEGITEGDPRNPSAPNGRPILGSSVKFSVGYDF